jgi:hypothetical protein
VKANAFSILNAKKDAEAISLSFEEIKDLQALTDYQINQLQLLQQSLHNISENQIEAYKIKEAIYKTEIFLYNLKRNINSSSIRKEEIKNGREQP